MTPEATLLLAWLDEAEAPAWVVDGIADALPKIEAASRLEEAVDRGRADVEMQEALLETRTERDGLYRDLASALADLRAAEVALGRVEALAAEWESGEYDRDMGSEGRHVLRVTARRIRLALRADDQEETHG